MRTNQKFQQSWERKRKDLSSQSEYDLSLASLARVAEWTPQEIVDLVISHRREGKQDLKLREDYYRRLLDKAAKGRHLEELESLADTLEGEKGTSTETKVDQVTIREALSKFLGRKVEKIVKITPSPCEYQLELNSATIVVGGIAVLDNQTKFRQVVMDATACAASRF